VAKVKGDYRAAYARQIAGGAAKGINRRQAGGHLKPREAALSAKRPLRRERSLIAAAEAARG
jgi:hypothetical protein